MTTKKVSKKSAALASATRTGVGRRKLDDQGSDAVKQRIAAIARRHFAVHGYGGVSLKDIAAESGVASSLMNYYFDDKRGLFDFCLRSFADERMIEFNRIMSEPKSHEDMRVRLDLFVHEMASAALRHGDIFAIIRREMDGLCMVHSKTSESMELLFTHLFEKSFHMVRAFFKAAQKKKIIRSDLQPEILTKMLFNLSCEAGGRDRMAERLLGHKIDQIEFTEVSVKHIVELFCEGIVVRGEK